MGWYSIPNINYLPIVYLKVTSSLENSKKVKYNRIRCCLVHSVN